MILVLGTLGNGGWGGGVSDFWDLSYGNREFLGLKSYGSEAGYWNEFRDGWVPSRIHSPGDLVFRVFALVLGMSKYTEWESWKVISKILWCFIECSVQNSVRTRIRKFWCCPQSIVEQLSSCVIQGYILITRESRDLLRELASDRTSQLTGSKSKEKHPNTTRFQPPGYPNPCMLSFIWFCESRVPTEHNRTKNFLWVVLRWSDRNNSLRILCIPRRFTTQHRLPSTNLIINCVNVVLRVMSESRFDDETMGHLAGAYSTRVELRPELPESDEKRVATSFETAATASLDDLLLVTKMLECLFHWFFCIRRLIDRKM